MPQALAQREDIKLLAPPSEEAGTLNVPDYSAGSGSYSIDIIESYLKLMYPYAAMIIGSLSVLMVVVGSIGIVTSGGDSGKATEGKERIMYAILGLLLFLFASVILYTINPNFFQWGG